MANQPFGDEENSRGVATTRLTVALACAALLSACAAFTGQVSNSRDRPAEPAVAAAGRGDELIRPAAYVSGAMRYVATAPTYYDDRSGTKSDRARSQRNVRASPGPRPLVHTADGGSTRSRLARANPSAVNAPTSVVTSENEDATWHGATPEPALDVASIVFNMPTSMTLDRRTLIQLALATTAEARNDAITPAATDAARRTGQYIEARLSGSDFLIEPVTAGTQSLRTARTTEWLWLVTPKKPGKQHLQVTLTGLTDNDGGSAPTRHVLPTFEHTILVNTRWQDALLARIDTNAAWLWAALLSVPLLLSALYVRWRRRHRRWFRGGEL